MITQIYYRNGYRNVNPSNPPKDQRELYSFLRYNNAPTCIIKASGGYYRMSKTGTLKYICRTLYNLSLAEFLTIAKNDNYIPNIP